MVHPVEPDRADALLLLLAGALEDPDDPCRVTGSRGTDGPSSEWDRISVTARPTRVLLLRCRIGMGG